MFCPKCKDEYLEDVKVCSACGAELIEKLPKGESGQAEAEYVELVTVLETMDPGIIMIAKSLLDGSGIRYFAKNESIKGLFQLPWPVQIQVAKQDEPAAKVILDDLIDQ